MTDMEEFRSFISKVENPMFREYERMHAEKVAEMHTMARELKLNLKGANVLDIGPAYGSTLDACRDLGADSLDFIERHPVLFTYNRLKGYGCAYRLDVRKGMKALPARRYDLIWFKGTLSADRFVWRDRLKIMHPLHRYPPLGRFLNEVERLAAPGGTIVFCPHWFGSGGRREIPEVLDTSVTHTLLDRGYRILPFIAGHNSEPHYPVTFLKTMPRDVRHKRDVKTG